MALEDLTPAVREEAILDGADIDPATRLEYFLSKAANEVPKPTGSSDAGKVVTVNEDGDGFELDDVPKELPSYTSADKGKFLGLGEGSSSTTEVIVPQQTLLTSNVDTNVSPLQGYGTFVQSIDLSVFDNYDNIVITVDGTNYEAIKTTLSGYGECLAVYDNDSPIYIVNSTRFYRDRLAGFSATVSISVIIPDVAPVWEKVALIVPLTFDDDNDGYTATKKAEEIYSANSVVFTYNSPIEGASGMTWKGTDNGHYYFGAFIAGTETVFSASTADDYPNSFPTD